MGNQSKTMVGRAVAGGVYHKIFQAKTRRAGQSSAINIPKAVERKSQAEMAFWALPAGLAASWFIWGALTPDIKEMVGFTPIDYNYDINRVEMEFLKRIDGRAALKAAKNSLKGGDDDEEDEDGDDSEGDGDGDKDDDDDDDDDIEDGDAISAAVSKAVASALTEDDEDDEDDDVIKIVNDENEDDDEDSEVVNGGGEEEDQEEEEEETPKRKKEADMT